MTDQLTDDALAKRAETESLKTYGIDNALSKALVGRVADIAVNKVRAVAWERAHFDALKVHRDGLLLLMDLDHGVGCDMWGDLVQSTGMPCSCGLDQHIASLKQLLGVSQ